ncbi:hypothetical protein ACIRD6_32295 [Streptomyces sp. NPDC102473]
MTFTIRIEVNTSIWCGIHDRMSLAERVGMPRLRVAAHDQGRAMRGAM